MTALAQDRATFVGLPMASWAFAARTWIALVGALYISFWLELEAPASAALTVAILALPTRGQGLEKAAVRLIATAVGVVASIAIFGMFSQTGTLLLAVVAAWIGLCVFVAGLFDGNRAYAAAIGIITIALIAIQQIDTPQGIFISGLERGAAIAVGILAITLANELLAAPDYYPKVEADLATLHQRVGAYAQGVLRGESAPGAATAGLLRAITSLRAEVTALGAESSTGPARSAAARTALVELVGVIAAARALEALPLAATAALADRLVARFSGGHAGELPTVATTDANDPDSGLTALAFSWLAGDLIARNGGARRHLAALRAGRYPAIVWKAPLYRSWRIALENGIRSAICFGLAAALFVVTGWPTTEVSLSLVAILIALGATAPDPRGFTRLAAITIPFACLIAGVIEFLVLDGADAFPILALALAPVAIGSGLLMTSSKQPFPAIGRLLLIFVVAILAPADPQSYNPQTFLFTALFTSLATLLLLALQCLAPPLSGEDRLRRLLAAAHGGAPQPGEPRGLAAPEAAFRDAGRVGEIVATSATLPGKERFLDEAMACFDRTVALRNCGAALDDLADPRSASAREAGWEALSRNDAAGLLDVARSLYPAALAGDPAATAACARLTLASRTISAMPPATDHRERT